MLQSCRNCLLVSLVGALRRRHSWQKWRRYEQVIGSRHTAVSGPVWSAEQVEARKGIQWVVWGVDACSGFSVTTSS